MGIIRFQLPRREFASESMLDRTYMAGLDGVPWPCQTRFTNNCLVLSRDVSESGNFYTPWHVNGYGEVMLSTGSLMERERPYELPVELARGTVNRLRNQLAAWTFAGLSVDDQVRVRLAEAVKTMARTVTGTSGSDQRIENADRATGQAIRVMDLLVDQYTEHALRLRHQQSAQLQTLYGVNLGSQPVHPTHAGDLSAAFNSAIVPMNWRNVESSSGSFSWETVDEQIDWCANQSVRALGGPLINMDGAGLPDWLILWEDDFEEMQSYILDYVNNVVQRYRGKVSLWNCAARLSAVGAIQINEEQRLNLTVRIIEQVRRWETKAPLIVSFDQPWAEQIAQTSMEFTPLHFADALARAGLGLSGFGLEFSLGYWPRGSITRDLLEISRQLDRWSLLGLPLVIYLTIPSSQTVDPQAKPGIQSQPCLNDRLSTASQNSLVERLVPLLLAKQCVHGIIWNQLDDTQPHDFPHGGLLDTAGTAKPTLQTLSSIRTEHVV